MAVDCYERLIPLVQTVLQQHELWKLTEADSSSLVDSILSSSERLSVICESRQQQHLWGCLTEQRFPDLPSRLLYKQRKSMETLLEGMQQTISTFKSVSSEIACQYKTAMDHVFQEFAGRVSEDDGKKRHTTRPSIHDILHWLGDITDFYSKEVMRKESLLATLKCEEVETVTKIQAQWYNKLAFQQAYDTIQYLRFTTGEQKKD